MRKAYAVILAAGLLAVFGLLHGVLAEARGVEAATAIAQSSPTSQRQPAVEPDPAGAPRLMATSRISIPYGVEPTLPLGTLGRDVLISGHGGCTENEVVTVELTVTQAATGATAVGDTQQVCNGLLQHWYALAHADTPTLFSGGAAEVCGIATTHDSGEVTDTYEWCRDVTLVWRSYLPVLDE